MAWIEANDSTLINLAYVKEIAIEETGNGCSLAAKFENGSHTLTVYPNRDVAEKSMTFIKDLLIQGKPVITMWEYIIINN